MERDQLRGQVDILLRLVESLAKPAELIKEVGEALAKTLAPQSVMVQEPPQQYSMGGLGLDDMAGGEEGTTFPLHEFDADMEDPSRWPTRGGWVGGQVIPPGNGRVGSDHQTDHSGMTRNDGQPMFKSGQTAPPPTGGVE